MFLHLCTFVSPGRRKGSVLQGLPDSDLGARGSLLSSALGLTSPERSLPPVPRGVAGSAGERCRPPRRGTWWSDQGDFGLEAGGAAGARADAGQHGDLRAARGPVAACGWVLVFGVPTQDALQVPAPPLPPQLCLHLGEGEWSGPPQGSLPPC